VFFNLFEIRLTKTFEAKEYINANLITKTQNWLPNVFIHVIYYYLINAINLQFKYLRRIKS